MLIRPFTPADYPAAVRIATAAFPEYPSSIEEKKFGDASRPAHCRHARWIAEQGGQAVGYGEYGQYASQYHPRKFSVDVMVLPEFHGQGFGKALYEKVTEALAQFDPLSFRAHVREDMPRGLRFLQDRGFAEDMRTFESRLDVTAFDPSPYGSVEARMRDLGIEFKTLRELQGAAGHWDKHHALAEELVADIPSPEPYTPLGKDVWRQRMDGNPELLPDGYFFAVKDGEYVGMSTLKRSGDSDDLNTGLTAVKREYRRQGVALALKLKAITWAKSQGNSRIKTWNESNNLGMLGINERLGFVRQPAWLDMVLLKEETK